MNAMFNPKFPLGRSILLLLVGGLLWMSCQTVREVTNLKEVRFRLDRVTSARLAGIRLSGIQTYEDFGATEVARLTSRLAQGKLPFSFTLFVRAENPAANSMDARLTKMDWTLLLDEQETVSGTFDREVRLPPGTPKDVPVNVDLDLVRFFGKKLPQLASLAAAVSGDGPPSNVKLRVQPTVKTALGPMKYPSPITVVSEDIGRRSQ